MTETATRTWENIDAGPIQVKRVNQAIRDLRWEGNTFVRVSGVVGGEEHRSTLTAMVGIGSPNRPELDEKAQEIGERFGWKVTKDNAKEIVAAFAEAIAEAAKNRPEVDERRQPDEDAEIKARMAAQAAEYAAESAREQALRDQVKAKAPAGAQAVIVAELKEDRSDPQSDYFNNTATRVVAIGFRFSKREDFRALRRAAGDFAETKHLGPDADKDIEHRDNYSMGAGNYLSDHGWDGSGSGWVVKSYPLSSDFWHVTEDAISNLPEGQSTGTGLDLIADGYEIRPSSLGREGVVEIHFAEKPAEEVRTALKAAGFRWARGNRCWYGREDRLPSLS